MTRNIRNPKSSFSPCQVENSEIWQLLCHYLQQTIAFPAIFVEESFNATCNILHKPIILMEIGENNPILQILVDKAALLA